MNEPISPTDTVAGIVVRYPGLSRVFETMRIDYCCGGIVALAEALTEHLEREESELFPGLVDAEPTGQSGVGRQFRHQSSAERILPVELRVETVEVGVLAVENRRALEEHLARNGEELRVVGDRVRVDAAAPPPRGP